MPSWTTWFPPRSALVRPGRAVILLFAWVFVAACKDGIGPDGSSGAVVITLGGERYDEQTVAVGDALPLSAQVLEASGDPVPGEKVSWSSSEPDVATVDGNGLVLARAIGTTHIIARHRVGVDSARVNVAAPITGPVSCASAAELSIEVGGIRSFPGDEAFMLCLPGPANDVSDYAVMLVNTAGSPASSLAVQLMANGISTVFNPPSPSRAVHTQLDTPLLAQENVSFHSQWRERSSRALEPLLQGPASPTARTTRQLQVNELVTLNGGIGGDPCEAGSTRSGVVRHVSQRAAIVEDLSNPPGGFSNTDYAEFASFFDTEVWPLVTETFGAPSDIDQNGRAIIFFTVTVNELPENSNLSQYAGSFIGGFFFNRDLFSVDSCAGSNAAEMFYLMVPDPVGDQDEGGRRQFSAEFVKRRVPTLLVHEFQHLVNDSRRLHINRAPVWEQTWLNEGLSHIAEELMFFRRSGLQPRQNLGPTAFGTAASRDAFRSFQLDNVDRLTAFLGAPMETSLIGPDGLATRGATWSFLRYAADRFPLGEQVFWQRLVRDPRVSGFDNLRSVLGEDPQEWVRDWAVAVYADDTQLGGNPRYQVPSWNFRAIYGGMGTVVPTRVDQPYPIQVERLQNDVGRTVTLLGGSGGYLRVGVPANGRAAVRITVGGSSLLPPPARLKVIVARVR
jgi:hypothetical protein